MPDHYVRSWDWRTDTEEWSGPFLAHIARYIAAKLAQKGHTTRVYHRSELPGAPTQKEQP